MIFWLAERTPRTKQAKPTTSAAAERPKESFRETFDQLIYSFALLIVGRAFFLEPFVIPTGSMAPTLYGRHKECVCSSCGFEYQVGASSEVAEDPNQRIVSKNSRIRSATCPNCRKTHDVTSAMVFNGDHVAVNKWVYQLGKPSRFDVFVFKYPNQAYRNYIKRVVGLPGETLIVRGGDLYLQDESGESILRKPEPRKRRAMTQIVHDNNWSSQTLRKAGWPERWQVIDQAGAPIAVPDDSRTVRIPATAAATYTHWIPSGDDWATIERGQAPTPTASLVSDFAFYNAHRTTAAREGTPARVGQFGAAPRYVWVPDIGFEADVELDSAESSGLTLEIREGIYRYRCHLDGNTGLAKLVDVNVQQDATEERPMAQAQTRFRSNRSFHLRFSNIDDELMLWIDGEVIEFGDGARYTRTLIDNSLPTREDLSPIKVTALGAEAILSNLRVFRDVYYVSETTADQKANSLRTELSRLLRDPDAYAARLSTASADVRSVEVAAGEGYLAFGDNSPASNDSRLWGGRQPWVAPHLLVGKAFFVYWPHGTPFLNGGRGISIRPHYQREPRGIVKVPDYPRYVVPFYPQFERMTRIR